MVPFPVWVSSFRNKYTKFDILMTEIIIKGQGFLKNKYAPTPVASSFHHRNLLFLWSGLTLFSAHLWALLLQWDVRTQIPWAFHLCGITWGSEQRSGMALFLTASKEFTLKKWSKGKLAWVQIAKLQEVKIIKNETYMENKYRLRLFNFCFPNSTFIFIFKLQLEIRLIHSKLKERGNQNTITYKTIWWTRLDP